MKPGQTVEFNVGATSQYYMDLSRTRLCANVRILGEDGNTLPANSDVAFINLSLHSIFRQVDLFLNGKNLCGDISVNYPMKSIMDTLLEETDDYLKSAGRTEMFYKDERGFMDSVVVDGQGTNFGLVHRYRRTKGSRVVQLSGVLHADLMGIRSYIPNGISLGLKLYPSASEFCLMSPNTSTRYLVDITDCRLLVQYVEPTKQLLVEHNEMLTKGPALLPFWRSNVRCFTIPANMTTWGVDGIFSDQIPDTLTVGLVSTASYTGKLDKNPFNFQNFALSFLGFYVEGAPVNSTVLQPDFENDLYTEEYLSLFDEKNTPGRGLLMGAKVPPIRKTTICKELPAIARVAGAYN